MKTVCRFICLLFVATLIGLLPTGCVKTRTVSRGGQVISKGPVLVSPVRGTLRSHTDRR